MYNCLNTAQKELKSMPAEPRGNMANYSELTPQLPFLWLSAYSELTQRKVLRTF